MFLYFVVFTSLKHFTSIENLFATSVNKTYQCIEYNTIRLLALHLIVNAMVDDYNDLTFRETRRVLERGLAGAAQPTRTQPVRTRSTSPRSRPEYRSEGCSSRSLLQLFYKFCG